MKIKGYSKATILWVDDGIDQDSLSKLRSDPWHYLFGDCPSQIFRLMDLNLEVARTGNEAVKYIEEFEQNGSGTFLFCIVDLGLPMDLGDVVDHKNGVLIASKIKVKGYPFVFLSSCTQKDLNKHGLAKIPYFTKEIAKGGLHLPEALSQLLLSEIRKNISWISLDDICNNIKNTSGFGPEKSRWGTFKTFPFFGVFKDFVERCEYRGNVRANLVLVRSKRDNCDLFVQQAIAIFLYQTLINNVSHKDQKLLFGKGDNDSYINQLIADPLKDDPLSIAIIRCDSREADSKAFFKSILEAGHKRSGMTIIVIPNDDSSEVYLDEAKKFPVLNIGDLPQIPVHDVDAHEELVRHACSRVFESRFGAKASAMNRNSLNIFLTHPELIINPIDWLNLLHSSDIPEKLSDSYEIIEELQNAISQEKIDYYLHNISNGLPLKYCDLLQVGRNTFVEDSRFRKQFPQRLENAIDYWLRNSWDFPSGCGDSFKKGWKTPCSNEIMNRYHCKKDSCDNRLSNQCGTWEAWQDHSYEVLAGLLEELELPDTLTSIRKDLEQVSKFVKCLGDQFLDIGMDHKDAEIRWEKFEQLRWPHHHYPMPSAVKRRLRAAGKTLWIQPDALNLSAALPNGRQRYRRLNRTIDHYYTVISWANTVRDSLPDGWKQSIGYLIDAIDNQQVAELWESEPNKLWNALLGLLRNGLPVLYITDALSRNVQLTGGKKGSSVQNVLASIDGYGKLCGIIRGQNEYRRGELLQTVLGKDAFIPADLQPLRDAANTMNFAETAWQEKTGNKYLAIGTALQDMIRQFSNDPDNDNVANNVATTMTSLLGDTGLNLSENGDWYQESFKDLKAFEEGFFTSLLGTKGDYIWKTLDVMASLRDLTRPYRHFDGYHLMACLNELRVENKDTRPEVSLASIENLLEVFLFSVQGIVAQLAWCIEQCGYKDIADSIRPNSPIVVPPETFSPSDTSKLDAVMTVKRIETGYQFYTLGIPGNNTVTKLCYHKEDHIVKLNKINEMMVANED